MYLNLHQHNDFNCLPWDNFKMKLVYAENKITSCWNIQDENFACLHFMMWGIVYSCSNLNRTFLKELFTHCPIRNVCLKGISVKSFMLTYYHIENHILPQFDLNIRNELLSYVKNEFLRKNSASCLIWKISYQNQ